MEDTCRALITLLERGEERLGEGGDGGACRVFNLGSGRAVSVLRIAELVCNMTGRSLDLITHIGDRPGQVSCHVADASRFAGTFGWRPEVGFEDGLERTIAWYASNEEWWRRLEWMKHVPVRTTGGEIEYH